jgi:putative flippase GtrA
MAGAADLSDKPAPGRSLFRSIVFFLIAGSVGFGVDALVLALLLASTTIGPFWGRLISMAVAILTTWPINRTLSFGRSRHHLMVEGVRYGGMAAASAGFNYLVYASIMLIAPHTPPLLALAAGSASAMILSFLGYSRLVFQK